MKNQKWALDIIEDLNEQAHEEAWDQWVAADELMESEDEDDWETAEELREEASLAQAGYFRENYATLDSESRMVVEYWIDKDPEFKDQFRDWYGHEEFDTDFE